MTNIFESPDTLFAHCNSGTTVTNTKGMLGSLEYWLNENRIYNLLSIPELTRLGYTITSDNRLNLSYQVTLKGQVHRGPDTTPLKIKEKGLPYIDVKQGVVFTKFMVPTVRENMEGFTKQEREKATLARETQVLLGHVSETELEFLVRSKKINDLPFNFSDFQNYKKMFSPSRAEVMWKTFRVAPDMLDPDYITIPEDFTLLHKKLFCWQI